MIAEPIEVLIQKVRDELGELDERSEQFVATLKKVLQDTESASRRQPSPATFVSRNIAPEEYEALPRAEKRRYHDETEKLNQRWVENQLNRLQAKWLMVVDGQVVMHGATLDSYPDDEEFLALCEKTGKYPFLFVRSRVFAIEEHATLWHNTNEPGDAYPAITIGLTGNNSPFTSINPDRTFLLGRSVLFNLRPRLILDFDARRTEVEFKEATS
jgi:hypothetical protein